MSQDEMDSHKSWLNAEKKIDEGFRSGKLSREEAKLIHDQAQKNYSSQSYNKEMEKIKNGKS